MNKLVWVKDDAEQLGNCKDHESAKDGAALHGAEFADDAAKGAEKVRKHKTVQEAIIR